MIAQGPSEVAAGTQRAEALADGVFSIVLTLLVFEIVPPRDKSGVELVRGLLQLWPSFLAFLISVGLVGIFWTAHYAMFRMILRTDFGLIWLNLIFLAMVSLLPFSTRLIAGYHTEPIALAIYGANLVLIGLSLLALWLHATRDRRLVSRTMRANVVRYGASRCLFSVVGYTLASGLAFLSTSASLFVFAMVPVAYIAPASHKLWFRIFGIVEPPGRPREGDGLDA